MYHVLYLGTIIFVVLGMIISCAVGFYVSSHTKERALKGENRSLAHQSVVIATFCMWLVWISTYLHQLHPLVNPILEHHE